MSGTCKTYLSLPKKGSAFPARFRTQSHGAPNAPLSTASWVASVNRFLICGVCAASTMHFASSAVKSFFESTQDSAVPLNSVGASARACLRTAGSVRSRLGGVQKQ